MMTEAYLENTATNPTARAPDTAPPPWRATPSVHRALSTPKPEVYSPWASSIWNSDPASSGSSRAQVSRSRTGRPRCSSKISAPISSAGQDSQYPYPNRPFRTRASQSMKIAWTPK